MSKENNLWQDAMRKVNKTLIRLYCSSEIARALKQISFTDIQIESVLRSFGHDDKTIKLAMRVARKTGERKAKEPDKGFADFKNRHCNIPKYKGAPFLFNLGETKGRE